MVGDHSVGHVHTITVLTAYLASVGARPRGLWRGEGVCGVCVCVDGEEGKGEREGGREGRECVCVCVWRGRKGGRKGRECV